MMPSVVVFPDPLDPSSVRNSPSCNLKLTSRSTGTVPYDLPSPATSMSRLPRAALAPLVNIPGRRTLVFIPSFSVVRAIAEGDAVDRTACAECHHADDNHHRQRRKHERAHGHDRG